MDLTKQIDLTKRIDFLLQEFNNLFDNENDAKKAAEEIKKGIDAPFVNTQISMLGGYPTIMIAISLDKKEDWVNKIYQNSAYMQFSLEPDTFKSNLEQFSKCYKISKKFRKSKVKNIKDVITKINKYIKEINYKPINEAKVTTLQATIKRRINQQLHKVGTDYYNKIPLDNIFNILKQYRIVVLQEDNTLWSGMLLGSNEQVYFDIADMATENNKKYIPFKNSMLALSYYKMSSGRYEINCYLT